MRNRMSCPSRHEIACLGAPQSVNRHVAAPQHRTSILSRPAEPHAPLLRLSGRYQGDAKPLMSGEEQRQPDAKGAHLRGFALEKGSLLVLELAHCFRITRQGRT